MKKLLLVTILSALLLISCDKEPVESPTSPSTDLPSEEAVEVIPDETLEEPRYEDFEYAITARDHTSIEALSYEKKSKEFLSAVCLGDREVLEMYMRGDTLDELMKIKADAMIRNGRTVTTSYGEAVVDEYLLDVRLSISKSDSDMLPVGIYDYILKVSTASMLSVQYFGSEEGYPAFEGAMVPSAATSPVLYGATQFIDEIFRCYGVPEEASLNIDKSFDRIFHTAVHTLMKRDESYIFTMTLEEFKEYIHLQFRYTNEELLQKFANALAKAPYASADENGLYTVCCAHGYGSVMCDLVKVDMNNGRHTFTYAIYADSTHTLQCREITFTFEENKDSDIMTLVEIESTKLNNLEPAVITV